MSIAVKRDGSAAEHDGGRKALPPDVNNILIYWLYRSSSFSTTPITSVAGSDAWMDYQGPPYLQARQWPAPAGGQQSDLKVLNIALTRKLNVPSYDRIELAVWHGSPFHGSLIEPAFQLDGNDQ